MKRDPSRLPMENQSAFPGNPWSWRHPFVLAFGAVVLLCFAVFSGSLGHELLEFDDNTYVYENPLIYPFGWHTIQRVFGETYFRSYTPLAILSHAIDFELWGMNPFGHHLTNVLLHAVNTGLMLVLAAVVFGLRRLSPDDPPPGLLPLLRCWTDVAVDRATVIAGDEEAKATGRSKSTMVGLYQAICWTAIYGTSVLAAVLGGYVAEHVPFHRLMVVLALVPLSVLAFVLLLPRDRAVGIPLKKSIGSSEIMACRSGSVVL